MEHYAGIQRGTEQAFTRSTFGNRARALLAQVVNIHTRADKTLDLLLTNSPSPVNRVKGMPPIGKADHDIVYVEYDIKAKRIQQAPRKIYLYKRADMDGLRDHLATYRDSFLSSDHSHMSVNDMWVSFKSEVIAASERFIRQFDQTPLKKTRQTLLPCSQVKQP